MEVTFTKLAGRRYEMTVARQKGPELAPRQGPGYDDWLPHDAIHFLVEAEAGRRPDEGEPMPYAGLPVVVHADYKREARDLRR